jgi:hypothetical protein
MCQSLFDDSQNKQRLFFFYNFKRVLFLMDTVTVRKVGPNY